MSEQPRNPQSSDSTQGESCGTSGSGCGMCGGGKLLLLLLVGLAAAYLLTSRSTLAPAAASAVPWQTDYDQALATAGEKDQPVLLAFKASWCGPCRQMDNEVFSKPAAATALSGWVPVSVDIDKQGKLANRYDVSGVPTFVVLSPGGKEVARMIGGMSLQDFGQFLASAQSKMNTATAAN